MGDRHPRARRRRRRTGRVGKVLGNDSRGHACSGAPLVPGWKKATRVRSESTVEVTPPNAAVCACVRVWPTERNETEQHHGNTSLDHCGNPRCFRHRRALSSPVPLGRCAYCRGIVGWARWREPLHVRSRTAWSIAAEPDHALPRYASSLEWVRISRVVTSV
jgi:hypothetical protein